MSDSISVIGLGSAGVNIALKFSEFGDLYKVFTIDDEPCPESKKHKQVHSKRTAEEYEKSVPKLKTFFRGISDEVIFIVCGAGSIAGLSLSILEQIKKKDISIVYIKPSSAMLSKRKIIQERVTNQVLQNYARSGLFKEILLIDNYILEQELESTIRDPYSGPNDAIFRSVHSLNYFRKAKPILNNEEEFLKGARIRTLGFASADLSDERIFFGLDNVNERRYYLSVGKSNSEDPSFLREIKEKLNHNRNDHSFLYFSIYSSEDEDDFGLVLKASAEIQD